MAATPVVPKAEAARSVVHRSRSARTSLRRASLASEHMGHRPKADVELARLISDRLALVLAERPPRRARDPGPGAG